MLKTTFCDTNTIIYKMIVNLDVRHDSRCEKYSKQRETNGKRVGYLYITRILHSSEPIRIEDQKELLYKL